MAAARADERGMGTQRGPCGLVQRRFPRHLTHRPKSPAQHAQIVFITKIAGERVQALVTSPSIEATSDSLALPQNGSPSSSEMHT